MHLYHRNCMALLSFVFVVAASPGVLQAQSESESQSQAQAPTYENGGLGAAAVLCSLLYGPVKVVWAISGLIVGGLAYPLSGGDADIMMKIINTSVRGDYVVTPSHLRGDQPLEFFGQEPGYGN